MPELKMVLVEWIDSSANGRWLTHEAMSTLVLSKCITIGYLMHEDEEKVVVAQSIDISEVPPNFNNTMMIPKVAITKQSFLRRK